MRLGTVAVALLVLGAMAATPPESSHNMPGQRRTRTAAAMKGAEKVPLRFSDGTPTGFYAWASDPSKNGDGGKPLTAGFMEMDAQEIVTTGSGMRLLLHPGGGPGMYGDPVEHGQYGHVALEDVKDPPTPRPQNLNGKPATLTGQRYFITPTVIPHDMFYKPNADEAGRTGSTYFTYGNPGYDKTRGRGDWTYLNWSWVQNGQGAEYPANKTAGGGLVRAVVRRNQIFCAADVPPIVGYSWSPDNKVNGRVTAIYGKAFAGPGESGSEIWGWVPLCYQKSGDIVVPCLRRANFVPAKSPIRSDDAMERTAGYFAPSGGVLDVRSPPLQEDSHAMIETLASNARYDSAEEVKALLKTLREYKDARAHEQVVTVLGFLASTPAQMKTVCPALLDTYRDAAEQRERLRIIEVVSNIPSPDSVEFLRSAQQQSPPRDDTERAAFGFAFAKLSPRAEKPATSSP